MLPVLLNAPFPDHLKKVTAIHIRRHDKSAKRHKWQCMKRLSRGYLPYLKVCYIDNKPVFRILCGSI